MASPLQVIIVIFILCFVSGMLGWTIRDFKGYRVKRFKAKRRKKYPVRYDWKGNIY